MYSYSLGNIGFTVLLNSFHDGLVVQRLIFGLVCHRWWVQTLCVGYIVFMYGVLLSAFSLMWRVNLHYDATLDMQCITQP